MNCVEEIATPSCLILLANFLLLASASAASASVSAVALALALALCQCQDLFLSLSLAAAAADSLLCPAYTHSSEQRAVPPPAN